MTEILERSKTVDPEGMMAQWLKEINSLLLQGRAIAEML